MQNQLDKANEEVRAAYAQQVLLYILYCIQLKATDHLYSISKCTALQLCAGKMLSQIVLITLGTHHPPRMGPYSMSLVCHTASSISYATDRLDRVLSVQEANVDDAASSAVAVLQGELQRTRSEAAERIEGLTVELQAAAAQLRANQRHVEAVVARNEELEQALAEGEAKLQASRHEVRLDPLLFIPVTLELLPVHLHCVWDCNLLLCGYQFMSLTMTGLYLAANSKAACRNSLHGT